MATLNERMPDTQVMSEAGVMNEPVTLHDLEDRFTKKESIINDFARITQFLMWPILFIIFHVFFSIKISGRDNFKKVKKPFLIVANHISFYDCFLFRLVLGPWTPHLPLRFMAVEKFVSNGLNLLAHLGIIKLIYSLFGVFTIVRGLGVEKNLVEARHIIRSGGNIVMYPEGKIVHGGEIGPFKPGAAILMRDMNIPAIPVSFRVTQGFIRKRIVINVGEVIMMNSSIETITATFKSHVEFLYSQM